MTQRSDQIRVRVQCHISLLIEFLDFTHVTNILATVTIRHLGVPQA